MSHQNKVAIVTGASSGIGLAVAELLAAADVSVALFDVAIESAESVADKLLASGSKARAYQVDIGNEQQVENAVETVLKDFGGLNMVCNSAAIQQYGRTEDCSYEDWRKLLNVNLNGAYFISKASLPALVESHGSLVNIASLAGKIGLPYDVAYSASKGGVIAMTKALAKEYADREVRINAIAPGAVDTPMYATKIPEGINPEVLGVIPRSARPMSAPSEIAQLVVYLLKDAPAPLTGSIISIDGASN